MKNQPEKVPSKIQRKITPAQSPVKSARLLKKITMNRGVEIVKNRHFIFLKFVLLLSAINFRVLVQ